MAKILTKSLFSGITLHYPRLDQLAEQLPHRVERLEKALLRHDKSERFLRGWRIIIFSGFERDEIQTDHSPDEMNLTDAVSKNLFQCGHFQCSILE